MPARKPRTECCCHPVARIIASIVAPAGTRSIAINRACFVSERCLLLVAMGVEGTAPGSFICGDAGLRAADRTVLRCVDLARASLDLPDCLDVVMVMGSSWHQRGAVRRTATAPPRRHTRRGRSRGPQLAPSLHSNAPIAPGCQSFLRDCYRRSSLVKTSESRV